MNYSIKYAKKGAKSLWLDKSGNKYVIGDLDTIEGCTTFHEEFDRFDDADKRFMALCKAQGMEPQNVEHDPNNFNFD